MTSDSSDDEFKSISNANHSRISQKMENVSQKITFKHLAV